MRRSLSVLAGLALAIIVSIGMSTQVTVNAQGKDKGKEKEDRLTGTIHMINKDTKTVTLRKGNVQRQIVYSDETKVTYRNKPSNMEEVKEGRRVICLGKFNDKTQLVATRIDVREGK